MHLSNPNGIQDVSTGLLAERASAPTTTLGIRRKGVLPRTRLWKSRIRNRLSVQDRARTHDFNLAKQIATCISRIPTGFKMSAQGYWRKERQRRQLPWV